jgi:predicted glycoside hydrolase/deacetylase ChbG (UPF0249 family)
MTIESPTLVRALLLLSWLPLLACALSAQATDDKIGLIVHADDLGVSHSTNRAFIDAWKRGLVNSGSIMVPTPWFPEIAEFAREHPEADLGLHLTFTAEWKHLKWGPVLGAENAPSLVDAQGYQPASVAEIVAQAKLSEVEAEIEAQIERAKQFGIVPTHLDSHMGVLFQNAELLQVLLRVAERHALPVLVPPRLKSQPWIDQVDLGSNAFWLESVSMAFPVVPAERWAAFYEEAIEGMGPGLHEIIIHVAYDDAEMQAVTIDHPDYGSAWRQRDLDVFTSDRTEVLLEKRGIELVTWRQIGERMRSDD